MMPPDEPDPNQPESSAPDSSRPPPIFIPPAPPDRFPFWGYVDLALFIGFFVVSFATGFAFFAGLQRLLHLRLPNEAARQVLPMFLGYLILFLLLRLLFRVEYDRPFWSSMGWIEPSASAGALIGFGILLAFAVGFGSLLLKTPEGPNPMTKLLSDHLSLLLIAIFGVTLGPLCEELIFRGFLQPLFVRSLGAAPGILLAAIPFGLLHLPEYGNSWRHGLLITAAGAAFGWVRHRTRSTKASTIMHAAYNATFFAALLTQWGKLPH
jgi:membrane protease YdiL (CAAX protease family)